MTTSDESIFRDFLYDICRTGDELGTTIFVDDHLDIGRRQNKVTLWIDRVDASAHFDIHHASATISSFAGANHSTDKCCCLVFHVCLNSNADTRVDTFMMFLQSKDGPPLDDHGDTDKNPFWVDRPSFTSRSSFSKFAVFVLVLLSAATLALAIPFFFSHRQTGSLSWPEDGYIRYQTPNSSGPKRQLQLRYSNATDWARKNLHQNGEWRMRMDDQALIPAELWDEDEDFYQTWYYTRYPHMREIIQQRKYMRPSWLGSLDVIVPWDKEFHFNHCVS